MSSVNFKGHLRRQLGFLERSCASYDAGFKDEAIRIATVIRVLLHDTKQSTSLLSHLNAKGIEILSTTMVPNADSEIFLGMVTVSYKDNIPEYSPNLENAYVRKNISVENWLNECAYMLGKETVISRKMIILAAANKDGGRM